MSGWHRGALAVASFGAAAMGGVFFAFSSFVMPALGRIDDTAGVRSMQAINRAAPTPWFMAPLFGTALVGAVLGGFAVTRLDAPGSRIELAGGALYLSGIVLTIAFHVPRNDALSAVVAGTTEAASAWDQYLVHWTRGNHVRTVTCLTAAACWVAALLRGS